MKTIVLTIALILMPAISMAASTIDKMDKTIALLGDDSFDVREMATEELSRLPGGCAKSLWILCKHYGDIGELEIAGRLYRVVKNIFEKDILTKDVRYLKLYAWSGLYVTTCLERFSDDERTDDIPRVWWVSNVANESPCDGKVNRCDIIEKVNDLPITYFLEQNESRYGAFKAGEEYRLTVRKVKDVDKLDARGVDIGNMVDYDPPQVVTIRVGKKDDNYVDKDVLQTIRDRAWNEFMEEANGLLR
jgi:hypothetical protein